MANRLADSTSPYLLQHQDNPVDWQEWGPRAFAEARERDVPVLLSVGYAACHWCHVMAHESFEDEDVAKALNAGFVAVKVDREERPDIDAVYMAATTALTGHGGWPMTCVLTPDGDPFFAGTYFPKGQFLQLLAGVTDAWTTQRDRVLDSGAHIASRLRELSAPVTGHPLDEAALDDAARLLRGQFDHSSAGFGGAPKFPPSMVLEFLLRHHARTGSADALAMAAATCQAMARGGLYDQLGGGFARYSVDAQWVVPHFEKMLYDNAQLLRVYTHLHRLTGDPLAHRVALETAEFLLRDLRTDEGGIASALDADTDGVEGLTYAWTPAQLVEVLGEEVGGFHDTSDDAEALFTRPRSAADNAEPSGQSALAGALLTCSALTGDPAMRERADAALGASGQVAARDPRFAGWALAVAEASVTGPLQVAVVGTGPEADRLADAARRSPSPGLVMVHGVPDAPGHPLLAQRPLVDGAPAAYVCRGFVCDAPVTDVAALTAALAR
jgi:uncharacterized protein YyaL (SSP411 family)